MGHPDNGADDGKAEERAETSQERVEEIDPLTLPCVAMSELRYLPTCAGIYFAIEEDGTVAYIGQSANIRQRWLRHHLQEDLCDPSDVIAARRVRLAWLEIGETDLLCDLERALIRRFRPRLNDHHNRDRFAVAPTVSARQSKVITTNEAAEILGVSPASMRVWLNEEGHPRFPNAQKRGRDWHIPESDLEGLPRGRKRGRPKNASGR